MTGSNLRERAQNGGQQQQPGSEVAEREQQTIGGLIQQLRPEIQRALPKGLDADRMARIALTVLRKTPKLAQSTPQSFAGSMLTASALGLEVDNGEAWLIPYEFKRGPMAGLVECQLILGYKGLAKLFYQHPLAQHLDCQAVHENDLFDFEYGSDPYLRHKPARADRGPIVYYYAVAGLKNGGRPFVVLTPEEIKAIRAGKEGPSGDIADPQHWMERKTALKQLAKTLPKSPLLAGAIESDERSGAELYRQRLTERELGRGSVPGEVVDDTHQLEGGAGEPAETTETGEVMSEAQKKKLHATLGQLGVKTHNDRVRYIARVVGREIGSSNEVTKREAVQVIDVAEHDIAAKAAEKPATAGES
ncbi:MAG: recombinase RecT [Pseudonocardiaceae bacterium]